MMALVRYMFLQGYPLLFNGQTCNKIISSLWYYFIFQHIRNFNEKGKQRKSIMYLLCIKTFFYVIPYETSELFAALIIITSVIILILKFQVYCYCFSNEIKISMHHD